MTTPYRAQPDGPFAFTVRYDEEMLRAARRKNVFLRTWAVVPLGAVATLSTLAVSSAPREHPLVFGAAVVVHLGLCWFFIDAWRKARARQRDPEDLAMAIDDSGVRFEAADGGWTHWTWAHVAEARIEGDALVVTSRNDQFLIVPSASYPDVAGIQRFVAARARSRLRSTPRALRWTAAIHALLVLAALVSERVAPSPALTEFPPPHAAPSSAERVAAALGRHEEPDPADLAAPADACEQADLAWALHEHGRDDLAPGLGPVEAALAHLAMADGPCEAADVRILSRVEAEDAVLGPVAYFALTTDEADGWWCLVGPEPLAPTPLSTDAAATPEWLDRTTLDEIVRRAAARHWLVLGRGPLGAPRLVEPTP